MYYLFVLNLLTCITVTQERAIRSLNHLFSSSFSCTFRREYWSGHAYISCSNGFLFREEKYTDIDEVRLEGTLNVKPSMDTAPPVRGLIKFTPSPFKSKPLFEKSNLWETLLTSGRNIFRAVIKGDVLAFQSFITWNSELLLSSLIMEILEVLKIPAICHVFEARLMSYLTYHIKFLVQEPATNEINWEDIQETGIGNKVQTIVKTILESCSNVKIRNNIKTPTDTVDRNRNEAQMQKISGILVGYILLFAFFSNILKLFENVIKIKRTDNHRHVVIKILWLRSGDIEQNPGPLTITDWLRKIRRDINSWTENCERVNWKKISKTDAGNTTGLDINDHKNYLRGLLPLVPDSLVPETHKEEFRLLKTFLETDVKPDLDELTKVVDVRKWKIKLQKLNADWGKLPLSSRYFLSQELQRSHLPFLQNFNRSDTSNQILPTRSTERSSQTDNQLQDGSYMNTHRPHDIPADDTRPQDVQHSPFSEANMDGRNDIYLSDKRRILDWLDEPLDAPIPWDNNQWSHGIHNSRKRTYHEIDPSLNV